MTDSFVSLVSPIPVQEELIPVDADALIQEFRATFRNEEAHMPEVSLRYLLWLILADQPEEEIKRFANQVRLDLNEQRLASAISKVFQPTRFCIAGGHALAVS